MMEWMLSITMLVCPFWNQKNVIRLPNQYGAEFKSPCWFCSVLTWNRRKWKISAAYQFCKVECFIVSKLITLSLCNKCMWQHHKRYHTCVKTFSVNKWCIWKWPNFCKNKISFIVNHQKVFSHVYDTFYAAVTYHAVQWLENWLRVLGKFRDRSGLWQKKST